MELWIIFIRGVSFSFKIQSLPIARRVLLSVHPLNCVLNYNAGARRCDREAGSMVTEAADEADTDVTPEAVTRLSSSPAVVFGHLA